VTAASTGLIVRRSADDQIVGDGFAASHALVPPPLGHGHRIPAVEALIWDGGPPSLRAPILIAAFAGWNDAASSATTAIEAVALSLDPEPVARIDPEEFYDFQVTRPTIRLTEGQSREIDWPENALLSARTPAADRDVVLLAGVEPNLRWRGFAATILDAAQRLGIEMVVTMGALLADVPHTRPVPITGLASDADLLDRLGLDRSSYEGPTGIVGVLHDACRERGLASASLWAAVPHYVAAVPNPKAALALLRKLEALTGIAVDVTDLDEAVERFDRQVDAAVAANSEIEELVRRLEEERDQALETGEDVPSGDAIARDFQRFLRKQGEHGEG
jgi:proteasome assembly chaperone (PAC2) family protein